MESDSPDTEPAIHFDEEMVLFNAVEPTKQATIHTNSAMTDTTSGDASADSRRRTPQPYPRDAFEDVLLLAEAIHKYASGQKVRRLTLLKQIEKSPTSSATRDLITNSSKYGLTIGNFSADWLQLTEIGYVASLPEAPLADKKSAQFKLAIESIAPFKILYDEYKGKKLPTHDVLKDALLHHNLEKEKVKEFVDLFIVNVKYIGLLQTIAGSETLVPIEQVVEELSDNQNNFVREPEPIAPITYEPRIVMPPRTVSGRVAWDKTCFIVTPIGEDGSEIRKHADLFLDHLITPALREFEMDVVRADKIGSAGMITSQILEYLMRSRLVVADLSHHNPNAFYEMAVRHMCRLPIVQISRKADRLPFDVNQIRTVIIDTSDIYTLIPKLETYRSEIAIQVKAALNDSSHASNPISVFFPGVQVVIPKEVG